MSNGELPRFLELSSALQEFVTVEGTQSQLHIRPLHQYLTVRLALESNHGALFLIPYAWKLSVQRLDPYPDARLGGLACETA